jgi:hypothetical protein
MSELPRLELPSLLAQTDQVTRVGGARLAARDLAERIDQDYELELHSQKRSEEVAEAENVASADDKHEHERRHPSKDERRRQHDDPDDDEPHLVDVTA